MNIGPALERHDPDAPPAHAGISRHQLRRHRRRLRAPRPRGDQSVSANYGIKTDRAPPAHAGISR